MKEIDSICSDREFLRTHESFDISSDGQFMEYEVAIPKLERCQYIDVVKSEWLSSRIDTRRVIGEQLGLNEEQLAELEAEMRKFSIYASHENTCLTITRQVAPVTIEGDKIKHEETKPRIIVPLREVDDLSETFGAYFGFDPDIKLASVRLAMKFMLDIADSMIALELLKSQGRLDLSQFAVDNIPDNFLDEFMLRKAATDIALILMMKNVQDEGLDISDSQKYTQHLLTSLPNTALRLYRKYGDITFFALAVGPS